MFLNAIGKPVKPRGKGQGLASPSPRELSTHTTVESGPKADPVMAARSISRCPALNPERRHAQFPAMQQAPVDGHLLFVTKGGFAIPTGLLSAMRSNPTLSVPCHHFSWWQPNSSDNFPQEP